MSHARRVLVVDDDVEVTDMLALYLGGHGFQVEGVTTGEDALARSLETYPHLILMDITLPDVDGFEVCVRLRQQPRTAHIPVIFLTKRDKRSERLAGLQAGADDYITKPFDLQELHLRVRNLIGRLERENHVDPLTGLPGEKITRAQMEAACQVPQRAILRLWLQHAEAFREVYGPLAYGDVRVYLAHLILNSLNVHGKPHDFIGVLNQECFVVVSAPGPASVIGGEVATAFNATAGKHYSEADRERGYLELDGAHHPVMQLQHRVFLDADRPNAL